MPSFLQRWWVHVLVSSGGQHPQDIDYRARGLLQPYESLKAATPGPARARNRNSKGLGSGVGGEPAEDSISHTTPCPAYFTRILQISGNHLQALHEHTQSSTEPATSAKTEISKQSHRAKSSWRPTGQASSTVLWQAAPRSIWRRPRGPQVSLPAAPARWLSGTIQGQHQGQARG